MTELQIGLIALGGAAVAAVLGYNKWQEARQRKLAEAVMKPRQDDVLLERCEKPETLVPAERNEPVLEIASETPAFAGRVEPVLAEPGSAKSMVTEVPPVAAATPEPLAVPAADSATVADIDITVLNTAGAQEAPTEFLDPRLEYIVSMELVEPVSAMQILHSQRDVLLRLNKPVHFVGFNERTREWEPLGSNNEIAVRRLRIGLQLVNRRGPVSEGDLAIFINAMRALADELMAVADMPSSRVLEQAIEIDRFCAAVDLEIGINLVSRNLPFPGTKIRALAEAAGMVLGAEGAFTRYDDDGQAQFSLQNYESTLFSSESLRNLTTHGLTFLLDVPRVDHGERVFMQMTEIAKRFADTLQGAVVDDNRQPLTDPQLEHIRTEFIGKPQATMVSYGLPAGSPQALRLFS